MQQQLKKELAKAIHNENFDVTESGLYFPTQSVGVKGEYFERINDGEWMRTPNLITKEGLVDVLNTYFINSKAKQAGFYLALFSGATAPAANWTAANFASVANEITSMTEGYTSATRPQFNPASATDQTYIDNLTNTARLTIATTSQLNVTGTALLTNSSRGGTTGILVSATKYPAARVFQNGDTYDVGYRFALTV